VEVQSFCGLLVVVTPSHALHFRKMEMVQMVNKLDVFSNVERDRAPCCNVGGGGGCGTGKGAGLKVVVSFRRAWLRKECVDRLEN